MSRATDEPSLEARRLEDAVASRLFGENAPTRAGRFVVIERLGAGAMGTVYAAYDPTLDRKVALKVLNVDAADDHALQQRIEQEARVLARLNHPNVLTVHDVGEVGRQRFIATEFVEGGTLSQWWTRHTGAPDFAPRLLELAMEAARGLAAAHDADLIHRDVKPGNLLVGDDGRLRVADFGLARTDEFLGSQDLSAQSTQGGGSDGALTRTGAAVGTPAYMAPEQFEGRADARSDQFGWAASFYEAFCGTRPYPGRTPTEILEAARTGQPSPAVTGVDPPAWFRKVLVRALSPDPNSRFTSMRAVVDAIENGRTRARQTTQIALALTASGLLAVAVVRSMTTQDEPPCEAVANGVREVWTPQLADEIQAKLATPQSAYTEESAARVRGALDDYADALAAGYEDACSAAYERHEHSPEVFDQRTRCLDQRRRGLAGLAQVLSQSTAVDAAAATRATANLEELAPCANLEYVAAIVKPPTSAAVGEKVDEIEGRLAQANALRSVGAFEAGRERTTALRDEAGATHYAPIIARTTLGVGQFALSQGDFEAAAAAAREAFTTAHAAGDDRTAVDALIMLAGVIGQRLANYDEALRWLAVGEASATRAGLDDPTLQAGLLDARGAILTEQGEFDAAAAAFESALSLLAKAGSDQRFKTGSVLIKLGGCYGRRGDLDAAEPHLLRALGIFDDILGPDHPETAGIRNNLGLVASGRGKFDEARKHYERALSAQKAALGENHADVAMTLQNLGNLHAMQGEFTEALQLHLSALAILERVHGPDHPMLARGLGIIGEIHRLLGQPGEAIAALQRAQGIQVAKLGADHPDLAGTLTNLGLLQRNQGRLDQALASHREALRIRRSAHGSGATTVAESLQNIAAVLLIQQHYDEAAGLYLEALSIQTEKLAEDHPDIGVLKLSLGQTRRLQGQSDRAAELLQEAVAILEPAKAAPATIAEAHLELARCLAARDPTSSESRAHAQTAETLFASAGPPFEGQRADAELIASGRYRPNK